LLGIEPSAILTFRDEYVDLADDNQFAAAKELSSHVFLIDEFIAAEIKAGRLDKTMFTKENPPDQTAWTLPAKSFILGFPFGYHAFFPGKLFSRNHSIRLLRNGWFIWI
jgi:hypothetical protein